MSNYVMSDIHGDYKSFLKALKEINFKNEDTLYIIGDVCDRGPQSLEIYEYIICHKNIKLLRGNHEEMLLEAIKEGAFENNPSAAYLWRQCGGESTFNQLLMKELSYINELYRFISKTSLYEIVDNKFILCHAGLYVPPGETSFESVMYLNEGDRFLWRQDHVGKEKPLEHYTIICGHIPVQKITSKPDPKILSKNGTIYIDCGLVTTKYGALGILRLDDMKEFYVRKDN